MSSKAKRNQAEPKAENTLSAWSDIILPKREVEIKRSETLLSKLEQKDHILRLARGAKECGISFEGFIAGLIDYVNDERAIDRQPLCGWWNLGGPYLEEKK